MLGYDFNSWGVETRSGEIPPLRRCVACRVSVFGWCVYSATFVRAGGATATGRSEKHRRTLAHICAETPRGGVTVQECQGESGWCSDMTYHMGRGDTQGLDSSSPAMCGLLCGHGWLVYALGDLFVCERGLRQSVLKRHRRTLAHICAETPRGGATVQECRGESGWCSDMTSTHGAWRHAGARFLLSGDAWPVVWPRLPRACLLGNVSSGKLGDCGNPFWRSTEGRWPTSVHKRRAAECLFRNAGGESGWCSDMTSMHGA